ncbi:acetylcholine receptor subunit alpha-L1-like [Saccostrea cucullata]|uniref:acetylcholine receptor subunit alpha-L1-like n=1 Tax=Saccostrea cuccullata TaxID=36930 RepID=UPI002ED61125
MVPIFDWAVFYFIITLSMIPVTEGAWSHSDVHTIRGTILATATYHKLIRPSETTNVNVSLNLLTINNLEVKTQTLSTTGWLTIEWVDNRLTWNSGTYPDVTHVYSLDSEVWKPELFIDNSLADVSILVDDNVMFKISRDGVVEWKLPRIFTTFCNVDVTYYPFDTQNCVIEITSWAYTIDELVMNSSRSSVNIEDIKPHGEWSILSSSVAEKELQETKVNGDVEKYSQLHFSIKMQRKSNYYISSVLLPILLTSYLNNFVFILPVDSGEKVGFILTVLLALAVLLTLVSDSIPSTSINTSVLSVYLAVTLCLGVLCCLLTVLVIRIHFKDPDTPVSAWWKSLHDKLLVPFSCWNGCLCRCRKDKNNVKPTVPNNEVVVVNYEDGKDDTTTVDESGTSGELKWTELSAVLDHFFLIVMVIITTISSIIFMISLAAGGKINT